MKASVYVFGSDGVSSVSSSFLHKVDVFCNTHTTVFIGNENCIDLVVQKHLIDRWYKDVVVFSSNSYPIYNSIAEWGILPVSSPVNMSYNALYGLCVWDGEPGDIRETISHMVTHGKTVDVYCELSGKEYLLNSMKDYKGMCKDVQAFSHNRYAQTSFFDFLKKTGTSA